MKPRLLVILGVGMALLAISYRQRGGGPTSFQALSFDDALKKAGAEKKLVMIDFFTTWCGPCHMLDDSTWPDAKVRAEVEEKVVAIKLDAEKEATLAARYSVDAYPTVLFVKADGEPVGRLVGFRGPEEFLTAARGILDKSLVTTRP